MPDFLRKANLKAGAALPVAALLLQTVSISARADVQVSGETGDIEIVASEASLGQVLDALSTHYGVQSRLPPNLDRAVSGTFGGSLGQLLSRLLQGYNFVVVTSASGTKVVVYDLNKDHGSGGTLTHNSLVNAGANPVRPPPVWNPSHPLPGFPPIPGLDAAHQMLPNRRHMNR